ncbi:MAG: 50S ribosomal protein L2 [Candidatus Nanoarchaeia archaeon]|nr:50S ribosomal protein L2 [Candidatus Nanoarchaeia archaeon]
MGKRIVTQRRGSGNPRYTVNSHKFLGKVSFVPLDYEGEGTVIEITRDPLHKAPLMFVDFTEYVMLMVAPEGVNVGSVIYVGKEKVEEVQKGSIMPLGKMPSGTMISNIELVPGDGGKLVRTPGNAAKIMSTSGNKVIIQLPSKKTKEINENCRAMVGIIAGSGASEKPMLKAGNNFYKMHAVGHLYPHTSGTAMSAVDHPFGNKRTSRKARNKPISRNAPPGRKVGSIAARRTGKKR